MRPIDCGIDIGSTNLKIILVTDEGEILGVRATETPRVEDNFGKVTSPLGLIALLEDMIIDCWQDVAKGQPLRSITSVGVGEDGFGVDADLNPTGYCIPWFDHRATLEAMELKSQFDMSNHTGIAIASDRSVAKWLWMYHNWPNDLASAKSWVALTDYPAIYWTGKLFMSASLAPRTAAYDVFKREWLNKLLTASYAPPIPQILGAGTPIGKVQRGNLLHKGIVNDKTVVAVGGHDHPIAASVIRSYDNHAFVDSLGTANLLYAESVSVQPGNYSNNIAISIPPNAQKGNSLLGVLDFADALNATGASKAEIRAFLANDRLEGEPNESDSASLPIKLRRSIETQCFHARSIMNEMQRLGVNLGPIYSTGGWSRSKGLMSLRASIFGQSLYIIDDLELSALGAVQYGAKAATGQLACLIQKNDVKCLSPFSDWTVQYEHIIHPNEAR